MKMLSLFSGAGMIDLAASWAGIETVAFCEIEEYPTKILQRRFPGVPIYRDVRELTAEKLKTDGISKIDIISGGFPCQDVSTAGKRTGFVDSEGNVTRSGLWGEYARLICELKPRWIVAENVRGLLSISAAGIRGGRIRNCFARPGRNGVSCWMVMLWSCRCWSATQTRASVHCGLPRVYVVITIVKVRVLHQVMD